MGAGGGETAMDQRLTTPFSPSQAGTVVPVDGSGLPEGGASPVGIDGPARFPLVGPDDWRARKTMPWGLSMLDFLDTFVMLGS